MSKSNLNNCFRWQFVVLLLLIGGIGCGGGTGSSSSSTGTVSILFTDGPSDDFEIINVTIDEIELRGGEGGPISFPGSEEPFDLLSLQNFSQLFSVAEVREGSYNKVRLHVSRIELLRAADDPDPVVFGSGPDDNRLPANGKIDILAAPPLRVLPGGALLVEIDIDADESFHIVETGNGEYRFRPVVRLRVVQADLSNRLSRVSGTIEEFDETSGTMDICDPAMAMMHADGDSDTDADSDGDSDSDRGCVDVAMLDGASIFNESGMPTGLSALGATDPSTMSGPPATVVGQFRIADDDSDSDSDTEIAPADGDSDSATGDDGDSDSDSDGQGLESLVLDAVVVELGEPGTFTTVRGTIAANDPDTVIDDNDQFVLMADDREWTIQLQPTEGDVLGTRIFIRDQGESSTTDPIQAGVAAEIDGVAVGSVINAALIVIEPAE